MRPAYGPEILRGYISLPEPSLLANTTASKSYVLTQLFFFLSLKTSFLLSVFIINSIGVKIFRVS